MTNETDVHTRAEASRNAARELSGLDASVKNDALNNLAEVLDENRNDILEANEEDMKNAREDGMEDAKLDRLKLTSDRIDGMIDGIRDVVQLNDPVGEVLEVNKRPNGLKVGRQRVPLGVVGMIYESRPNVTVDAGILCLKSGNTIILRGGSEAQNTNYLLVDLMQEALSPHLPENSVQILRNQSHELVDEMLSLDDLIDVVIPRGGENLIDLVAEKSTIPVIKHYEGICHVYVSDQADPEMARDICLNAKTQRTSVCNAMETLLLNEDLSEDWVDSILRDLRSEDVELRVDETIRNHHGSELSLQAASDEDWETEYLDSILSVKTVPDLEGAINHINTYGNHSDAIVTESYRESETFLDRVDSAAVYVNASTRFTDGYEFGLGAEIGISTDRLHCRGPMGLRELTIPKYVVHGQGQVRN